MKVKVNMVHEETLTEGETIEEIIEKCGYTIESVIVLKKGNVVLEEDIADGDTIEIVPVASGG